MQSTSADVLIVNNDFPSLLQQQLLLLLLQFLRTTAYML